MNIVLIGMPGCGKSTVGVLLAKSMLYDFLDTDLVIQQKYSMPLCEIINSVGTEKFKQIEDEALTGIDAENTVIATGGSAVYGEKAMAHLKENGKIVYLKLPLTEIEKRIQNIKTRGIVMAKNETLGDIFTERIPLYERFADITVDCTGLTAEECVNKIISHFNNCF